MMAGMSHRRARQAASPPPELHCARCGTASAPDGVSRVAALRPEVLAALALDRSPGPTEPVCRACTAHARAAVFRDQLAAERGELGELETDIAKRAAEHVAIAMNLDAASEKEARLSDRLSDRLAKVGGSWGFVTAFLTILVGWMILNAAVLREGAFDPYPFILLNLVLSCVAAIQAPIILMSQNRAGIRDRAQATQDYRVNLKAELEVAALHDKLDLLLHHKWESLLALQDAQTDLLEELIDRTKKQVVES
jgi:uncharacterized membrane protein